MDDMSSHAGGRHEITGTLKRHMAPFRACIQAAARGCVYVSGDESMRATSEVLTPHQRSHCPLLGPPSTTSQPVLSVMSSDTHYCAEDSEKAWLESQLNKSQRNPVGNLRSP